MNKKILITGGAGFIGSALVRHIINDTQDSVINVDKLTYAGNLESLESVENNPRYAFAQVDICDKAALEKMFAEHQPDAVMHLAAESHVDRSINNSNAFIQTNIVGTYSLLEVSRAYWLQLDEQKKVDFRFIHISTDEVFGDLADNTAPPFTEHSPYMPNNPYSASKAASDHLAQAWHRTYGLPTIITNTSNNYGPYQYPEKLIPLTIKNALQGKPIPIYGDGKQIRDWIYVEDHIRALYTVLLKGKIGESYNIGSKCELRNIELVYKLCHLLNELIIDKPNGISDFKELIQFVTDRAGHDHRYSLDNSKIINELGWKPEINIDIGLRETVKWYIANKPYFN